MAAISPQLGGVKWPPLSSSVAAVPLSNPFSTSRTQLMNPFSASPVVAAAVAISNAQTRERERLKELFREARERCLADPMDGVSFTLDEFHAALDKHGESESQVGTKVKGTVFMTDDNGALVDIIAKSSAYLPIQEATIYKVLHVAEAGIYQGLEEEFVVIGENAANDSLILSLRSTQWDLAWERCQQLHSEDAVVTGKVVGQNKGGLVIIVEGLHGFIPFSQISRKSTAEDLINKKLPLKFLEVDKKQSRLVLSNCKAVAIGQAHIGIGSVVTGIVQGLRPYGAFIDIGGIIGLLHVSQISNVRVSDVATVLQPGDRLKVMILSQDLERGRVTLSTKMLEPKPGDMIQNPRLVFDKADEMAQTIMQRIAQAEAMAHADVSMSGEEELLPKRFSNKKYWC